MIVALVIMSVILLVLLILVVILIKTLKSVIDELENVRLAEYWKDVCNKEQQKNRLFIEKQNQKRMSKINS